jgi:hypothetical protein
VSRVDVGCVRGWWVWRASLVAGIREWCLVMRFVERKCSSLVALGVVELMRCGVVVCFVEVLRDNFV